MCFFFVSILNIFIRYKQHQFSIFNQMVHLLMMNHYQVKMVRIYSSIFFDSRKYVYKKIRFVLFLGDFSGKSYNQDSESSSPSSLYIESGADGQNDIYPSQDIDEDGDANDQANETMILTYKCSACEFTSNVQWNTQKHIQDNHSEQVNVHILTQCRTANNDNQSKKSSKQKMHPTATKMPMNIPLSPTNTSTKAKFCPAVEEALFSLQGSKINAGMYAVQPKFGIKRLKCRHCFYRSNWKTDMIRHVRIRHNLTEPDHNKGTTTID